MTRLPSLLFAEGSFSYFFFFNDTATTEIYTLSLHDALPISSRGTVRRRPRRNALPPVGAIRRSRSEDTRLNSSHQIISYAVFCLKKKNILFNNAGIQRRAPLQEFSPDTWRELLSVNLDTILH